jgi:preprotein translocase subunit YajC
VFLSAPAASGGFPWQQVVFFVLIFGAMYLLFIRPQSKRKKAALELQQQLGAGDEVMTIGGMYGTVVGVDDESVTLQLSPGVTARYTRQAIAKVTKQTTVPAGSDEVDTVTETDTPVAKGDVKDDAAN